MQEGLKAVLERNGLVQTHLGESTCCWRAGFMDSTISSGLSLFVPNVIQRNIPSIGGYVFLELRREVWGGSGGGDMKTGADHTGVCTQRGDHPSIILILL